MTSAPGTVTVHAADGPAKVVVSAPDRVVVTRVGIQGPPGSGGISFYRHLQNDAAALWTVTHNLGRRPSVTVTDSSEAEVFGDVQHLDDDTLKISFAAALGGQAYCV